MRLAGRSDEFADSVYEYKTRDNTRRIGVDLLRFYQLKINNQNANQPHNIGKERTQSLHQLNFLEKSVLRLLNIKVNWKLRYDL